MNQLRGTSLESRLTNSRNGAHLHLLPSVRPIPQHLPHSPPFKSSSSYPVRGLLDPIRLPLVPVDEPVPFIELDYGFPIEKCAEEVHPDFLAGWDGVGRYGESLQSLALLLRGFGIRR